MMSAKVVVRAALLSKFSDIACILSGAPLVAFPIHLFARLSNRSNRSAGPLQPHELVKIADGNWFYYESGILNATYLDPGHLAQSDER